MSEPQMPCSSTEECARIAYCAQHRLCWKALPDDERAYRMWHEGQMAKPFEERNFE